MRARLEDLPSVTRYFGFAATSLSQDENGARLAIAETDGPARKVIEADYVVGCDGGRSIVRDQAGIGRSGADFDQKMVLAVFRSRELHEYLERFPVRSTYRVMHPDMKGYWQFFGRIDVGEGWFFHAPVPADATRENCDVRALIERAAGFPFALEFDHVGFWDLRVSVAARYQEGRIFIAGDAAHTHPPYGGFGLNNSLEDAVNLGWKLAARLQGWGGEALLRSYGEERRPVFEEIGEDFIAARIASDRAFLERYSPTRDRAEFEQAWKERNTDIRSRLEDYEPNYEGSSVIAGPPGGRCTAHGTHAFKARAGHHLAPQTLSSGRNVFEALGRGFTLLAFDASDEDVGAFARAAERLNVPLEIVRDSAAEARAAYEARLVLVRPDQYVAWVGDEAPENAGGLFAGLCGLDGKRART
jgi:hypothetical protein